MGRLMFYMVVSSVFALVAQLLGAGFGLVIFLSLIGPPIVLLIIGIHRYTQT